MPLNKRNIQRRRRKNKQNKKDEKVVSLSNETNKGDESKDERKEVEKLLTSLANTQPKTHNQSKAAVNKFVTGLKKVVPKNFTSQDLEDILSSFKMGKLQKDTLIRCFKNTNSKTITNVSTSKATTRGMSKKKLKRLQRQKRLAQKQTNKKTKNSPTTQTSPETLNSLLEMHPELKINDEQSEVCRFGYGISL